VKRVLPLLKVNTDQKDLLLRKNNFLHSPGAVLRTESKVGMSLLFQVEGKTTEDKQKQYEQGLMLMQLNNIFKERKDTKSFKAPRKKRHTG
jgi:hypothetical protein